MKVYLENWQVKQLRNYFGENDKTQTAHWAYNVFDKALKEQLTIPVVVQPKANSSIIKPVCVCNEMTKEGVSSWWCEACKTDWV